MPEGAGRFQRVDRLLRSREFQFVTNRGRRVAGRDFVVVVARREAGVRGMLPRLGIAVSRKVGGAVVRNYVKRRIREWFRDSRSELARGIDIVVIARASAAELDYSEIHERLGDLIQSVDEARG